MVTFSVYHLLVGAQRAHLIFLLYFMVIYFRKRELLGYMSFSAFAHCSNHFACK